LRFIPISSSPLHWIPIKRKPGAMASLDLNQDKLK
jgi:hypothetical protein